MSLPILTRGGDTESTHPESFLQLLVFFQDVHRVKNVKTSTVTVE